MASPKPSASLILGAGWSYVAGLPLTKDLFRVQLTTASAESTGRLRRVADAYDAWASRSQIFNGEVFLEHVYEKDIVPWSWAVEYVMVALSRPVRGDTPASRSLRYAQRLNRPTYCGAHSSFVDGLLAKYELQGVFTTNYDILTERALRHKPMSRPRRPGFYYGGLPKPQIAHGVKQPFSVQNPDKEVELSGTIPLFKLHGSLNWERQASKIQIYQDLRLAFRNGGVAEIVPPVPEKAAPKWLKDIWADGSVRLRASDVWVVVGFSLPPYDLAIREYFHNAATTGNVKKVVVIDPYAEQLRERWADVAPGAQLQLRSEGLAPCAPPPELTDYPLALEGRGDPTTQRLPGLN